MSRGIGDGARSLAWRRETGLTFSQAATLIAAVAALETDGFPVWRRCVNALVERVDGLTHAGEDLRVLERLGLLVRVGVLENEKLYRPTKLALTRVRFWAGRDEQQGRSAAE